MATRKTKARTLAAGTTAQEPARFDEICADVGRFENLYVNSGITAEVSAVKSVEFVDFAKSDETSGMFVATACSSVHQLPDAGAEFMTADSDGVLFLASVSSSDPAWTSKSLKFGDLSSRMYDGFGIAGISGQIRTIDTDVEDLKNFQTEIAQRSGIFSCDVEQPYVISSIEVYEGMVSSLGGYRLSTAMSNMFDSTVVTAICVDNINVLSGLSAETVSVKTIYADTAAGYRMFSVEDGSDFEYSVSLSTSTTGRVSLPAPEDPDAAPSYTVKVDIVKEDRLSDYTFDAELYVNNSSGKPFKLFINGEYDVLAAQGTQYSAIDGFSSANTDVVFIISEISPGTLYMQAQTLSRTADSADGGDAQ